MFRKEVEIINVDGFTTDDGKLMSRIGYLEERANDGTNFVGKEYGEAYQMGTVYNDLKSRLPAKAFLEFGLRKDKNNRESIKLLTIDVLPVKS